MTTCSSHREYCGKLETSVGQHQPWKHFLLFHAEATLCPKRGNRKTCRRSFITAIATRFTIHVLRAAGSRLLNVLSTKHLALMLAICSPLRCIRSCSDSCSLATLFCWYRVLGLNTPSSSCCCRCSTAESAPAARTTSCCLACVPSKSGGAVNKIDYSCRRATLRV